MGTKDKNQTDPDIAKNSREHLANERTLLAWIRTSIAIMAFGFVVFKFTLFLKQLSFILQKNIAIPHTGYSVIIGIFLVGFGVVLAFFSYIQYKRVEKQLMTHSFYPSHFLTNMLIVFIVLTGILLIFYLIHSMNL